LLFPLPCYTSIMTIQQTVIIPADRRLHLDLPLDTPKRPAELKLTLRAKKADREWRIPIPPP
jgi:hypothetical protein